MPSSKERSEEDEIELNKFPSIKYPNDPETDRLFNDECVVTEKLDGANFRFTWSPDGELVFGSRNVKFTENGEPLPEEEVNADFQHAANALNQLVPEPDELAFDVERFTFFGEAMHMHSLQYDDLDYTAPQSGPAFPADVTNSVVLFDAWDHRYNEWVDWTLFRELADEVNLQQTQEIAQNDEEYLRDKGYLDIPDESMFGGDPEGIVVRRTDGEVRAKKVSEDFREKNAIAFNSPSKAESDGAEFVAMFATPGRIKSVAHSLVEDEEYDSLKMEMMEDLPKAVLQDILEEEGWNLICNQYNYEAEIDDEWKSEVRSRTSKLCARHLKKEINNF